MKNTYSKSAFALMLPAMCWVFSSCQKIDLGDASVASNDDKYSVKISSKSADSGIELPSPLAIYAVNDDDAIQDNVIMDDGSTTGNLSLKSGNYQIFAVAGATVEKSDILDDNIISAEGGYFTKPIMQGSIAVSVEDDDLNSSMSLSYAVASLEMMINNVPDNVVPINVKVSSQSETMSITRTYEGSSSATIAFSKQDEGTWKTEKVYLFPGTGSNTTFTITYQIDGNAYKVFTAKYKKPFEAGVPYKLNWSYNDARDKTLSISFDIQGWSSPVEETLEFTEIANEEETPQLKDASVVVWNEHVLIKVDANTGLLFSKNVWEKNQMEEAINSNTEGLSGWEIPSLEQVEQIKSISPVDLRDAISQAGGTTKKFVDYYYLCDNGEQAFSFKSNSIILNSTQKDENYRIRLVKPVTFKLKQE